MEDVQNDVTMATEAAKLLKRHACGTLTVALDQQLSVLDRRTRRVTRRYTRLAKSDTRSPKLEKYECCVDEIMDWLDETEAVTIEGTTLGLGRLQEQVVTIEVRICYIP